LTVHHFLEIKWPTLSNLLKDSPEELIKPQEFIRLCATELSKIAFYESLPIFDCLDICLRLDISSVSSEDVFIYLFIIIYFFFSFLSYILL